MEFQEQQKLLHMEARIYDLLAFDEAPPSFLSVGNKMVLNVKQQLDVKEVTLYLYDQTKESFLPTASTVGEIDYHSELEEILYNELEIHLKERKIIKNGSLNLKQRKHGSILIPLNQSGEPFGLLNLEQKKETKAYSDELLLNIGITCQKTIFHAQKISRIINEEKRYEQLHRVTSKFHSSMDMDDVLGEIIQTLQEVYPLFTHYLLLSHDNKNRQNLPIKHLQYDSEYANMAAMQAYVSGNIQFEDSLKDKSSILYVPLKGKQGVYGVLQVISPNTMMFPKNEIGFITLLANTAGSALENAQLYQQSKRLIADLQLINETSHRLNSNLRLTETMNFMCKQIMGSFHAQEVGFVLFNEENQKQILPGSTTFFTNNQAEEYIQFVNDKILKERDSLFIGDIKSDENFSTAVYCSLMAVPMVQSGTLKGLSIVLHEAPYHFSFEAFKLLQSLIHHSTLAFTNSMLREELEKLVVTDHLTKLYSRNYLDEKIQQSMINDAYGTFILIDIDNFKTINDTFGHQIGDEVIMQVADLIKSNIRENDIGARWGGEELAIYLPKVELEAGIRIAKRMVKKVEINTNPKITVSCGVSYWHNERADSVKKLFNRADEALYIAKNTGKNRVIVQEEG